MWLDDCNERQNVFVKLVQENEDMKLEISQLEGELRESTEALAEARGTIEILEREYLKLKSEKQRATANAKKNAENGDGAIGLIIGPIVLICLCFYFSKGKW